MDEFAIIPDNQLLFGKTGPGEMTQKQPALSSRLGRPADGEFSVHHLTARSNQLGDISRGYRVQVNTKSIHNKLFSKVEPGDGGHASATELYKISKRKEIVGSQGSFSNAQK